MLNDLTEEHVRSLFTYDPEEGLLRWRHPAGMGGRIPAGSVAGSTGNKEGYRYVSINGRLYKSSRLIWLYVTGAWPEYQIDHKDNDTGNDKWCNLREATQSQNKANCRRQRNNTIGYKNVSYYKDPRYKDGKHYRWLVTVNKKRIQSSERYATAKEAFDAVSAILPKLRGEFANS